MVQIQPGRKERIDVSYKHRQQEKRVLSDCKGLETIMYNYMYKIIVSGR